MKKLQNNFTTPEQSPRRLELGVPADSADCVLRRILSDCWYAEYWVIDVFNFIGIVHDDYMPCWSIGRLIEIMGICYEFELPSQGAIQVYKTDIINGSVVNVLISDIERFISKIDFSKLED